MALYAGLLASTAPGPAPSAKASVQVKAQPATQVLLITHPTELVVRNYATLAKDRLIDVAHLHIIGIYHHTETENYAAAHAFIDAHHLSWMSMRPVMCDLTADDVYRNNACREEFSALLNGADGIVFNGGADIQPSLYGAQQSLLTQVETPFRHIFEVSMLVHALGSAKAPDVVPILQARPHFPVLGICVGMQTMNVAAGGTLVQDIPSEVYQQRTVQDALAGGPATWHRNHAHELGGRNYTAEGVMHPIHVTPEAPKLFLQAIGDGKHDPLVLSVHHQAVGQVAPSYSVYATSEDGKIVEMMGHKVFPNVLAIQFHPERSTMWEKHERALMDPNSKQPNFVFDAMAHDVYTRAFNRGVWTWLSRQLATVEPRKARRKKAAADSTAKSVGAPQTP